MTNFGSWTPESRNTEPPKFKVTIHEGEDLRHALLSYRAHLVRERQITEDAPYREKISHAIVENDRIIHLLDVRIAATKDVANHDS
jgi:hypothetical protein